VQGATYLTALSVGNVSISGGTSTGTLTVGATSQLQGAVTMNQGLAVSGGITNTGGNISAGNASGTGVDGYQGTFSQVQGTLLTNAQPYVNSVGVLTNLAVTGNISAANIVLNWGHVHASNAVITGNLVVGANILTTGSQAITGNLVVNNVISGIGNFSNITVQNIPTVNSVTNKSYVTATVVGFAIGLGS